MRDEEYQQQAHCNADYIEPNPVTRYSAVHEVAHREIQQRHRQHECYVLEHAADHALYEIMCSAFAEGETAL